MSTVKPRVDPVIVTSREGPIVWVTLNRPAVLNALNNELKDGLACEMERLAGDHEVRVVVIKGAGRAFCAGADQKENATFDAEAAAQRMDKWDRLYRAIRDMPQPVVAQMQGYAAGGGLQVALLADIRIASDDANLGMTELNVGSPCILGSAMLWPLVGLATTTRMVLMGEFLDAAEALRVGLVHEVVPAAGLATRVDQIARALTEKPSTSMSLTKRWLRELGDAAFGLASLRARDIHAESYAAGDFTAGAKNFLKHKAE